MGLCSRTILLGVVFWVGLFAQQAGEQAVESVTIGGVEYEIAKGSEVVFHDNGQVRKATFTKDVRVGLGEGAFLFSKDGFVEFDAVGRFFSGLLAPGQTLKIDGNQYPFEGRLYVGFGGRVIVQSPTKISVEQNEKTYAFRGVLVVDANGNLILGQLPDAQSFEVNGMEFVRSPEASAFSSALGTQMRNHYLGMAGDKLPAGFVDLFSHPLVVFWEEGDPRYFWFGGSTYEASLGEGSSRLDLMVEFLKDDTVMVVFSSGQNVAVGGRLYAFAGKRHPAGRANPTPTTLFADFGVKSGTLTAEQSIKVGSRDYLLSGEVEFYPSGALQSAVLASEHLLQVGGRQIPFDGEVGFHPNGEVKSASLKQAQRIAVGGREFDFAGRGSKVEFAPNGDLVGATLRASAVATRIALGGETYAVKDEIHFHKGGAPKSVRLRKPKDIDVGEGSYLFKGLYFDKKGDIVGGFLSRITSLIQQDAQSIKADQVFFDEGKHRFVQLQLSEEQALSFDSGDGVVKKTYQKGEVLRLYKDGTLAGSGREWDWSWTGDKR